MKRIYKVMVTNISLAEMIKSGKYNIENGDFVMGPIKAAMTESQHEADLVLVQYKEVLDWLGKIEVKERKRNNYEVVTTQDILDFMNSQGLIAAKTEHLLSFACSYTNCVNITAVGNPVSAVFPMGIGGTYYPYISSIRDGRRVFYWHCFDWKKSDRFLAVKTK